MGILSAYFFNPMMEIGVGEGETRTKPKEIRRDSIISD